MKSNIELLPIFFFFLYDQSKVSLSDQPHGTQGLLEQICENELEWMITWMLLR